MFTGAGRGPALRLCLIPADSPPQSIMDLMSELPTVGTGIMVQAKHKYRAGLPPQSDGEHLWILVGSWRIEPAAEGTVMLDTENLLSIDGPGCYYCEEMYSPRLALRRCKGKPTS